MTQVLKPDPDPEKFETGLDPENFKTGSGSETMIDAIHLKKHSKAKISKFISITSRPSLLYVRMVFESAGLSVLFFYFKIYSAARPVSL